MDGLILENVIDSSGTNFTSQADDISLHKPKPKDG
jgi:hypothetical protein